MKLRELFLCNRVGNECPINACGMHTDFNVINVKSTSTLPHSEHDNISNSVSTPFRAKCIFWPPKFRNTIETYCRLVEKDDMGILNKRKEYKVFNNLSKKKHEALAVLKNDNILQLTNVLSYMGNHSIHSTRKKPLYQPV